MYRIIAENVVGCSRPSEACDPVIAREQVSPPQTVEVISHTSTRVDIKWIKPENDGGGKITGK